MTLQGNISAELPRLQGVAMHLAEQSRAIADRQRPACFGGSAEGECLIPATPAATRFLHTLSAARTQHDAALQYLGRYFDAAGLELSAFGGTLAEHDATHAHAVSTLDTR